MYQWTVAYSFALPESLRQRHSPQNLKSWAVRFSKEIERADNRHIHFSECLDWQLNAADSSGLLVYKDNANTQWIGWSLEPIEHAYKQMGDNLPSQGQMKFYGKTEEEAKAAAMMAGVPPEKTKDLLVILTPNVQYRTAEGKDPDANKAGEIARARVPSDAFDIGSPMIVQAGEKGVTEIQAGSEAEASQYWQANARAGAAVDRLICEVAPRHGFLGIGRKLGLWKAFWSKPFVVHISYKLPGVILAHPKKGVREVLEEKPASVPHKAISEPKAQVAREEEKWEIIHGINADRRAIERKHMERVPNFAAALLIPQALAVPNRITFHGRLKCPNCSAELRFGKTTYCCGSGGFDCPRCAREIMIGVYSKDLEVCVLAYPASTRLRSEARTIELWIDGVKTAEPTPELDFWVK